MQNYSVIEDLEISYISQIKWRTLLEKQLARNHYIFKNVSTDLNFQISKIFHKQILPIMTEKHSKIIEQALQKQKRLSKLENLKNQKKRNFSFSVHFKTKQNQEKSHLNSQKLLSPNKSFGNVPFLSEIKIMKRYKRQKTESAQDYIKEQQNEMQFVGSTVHIDSKSMVLKKQTTEITEFIESYQKKILQKPRKLLSLHQVGLKLKNQHPNSEKTLAKRINHIEKLILKQATMTPSFLLQNNPANSHKNNSFQLPIINKKYSKIDILRQLAKKEDELDSSVNKKDKCQYAKTRQSQTQNQTQNDKQFDDTLNQKQRNYPYKDYVKKQEHQRKQFQRAMYRITKIHPIKFPMFI